MKDFEGRKKDCLKALHEIQDIGRGSDPKSEHANADEVLLVCIGSSKIRRAFKDIKKWYA